NIDIIGEDYYVDGRMITWIRRPSQEDITYPACEMIGSLPDPHRNGMLLGRLWWDIYDSIPVQEDALLLFAEWTMLSNGAAPPDTGSSCPTYSQPADTGTLLEVLLADTDDDNDLSNGTDHSGTICQAFCERGIETQFTGSPCLPCAILG